MREINEWQTMKEEREEWTREMEQVNEGNRGGGGDKYRKGKEWKGTKEVKEKEVNGKTKTRKALQEGSMEEE